MKPVEFKEVNLVFGAGQEEYLPLPGYIEQDGTFTMCLELTEDEIIEMVKTRKLWLSVLTFNTPLQPLRMSTQKPEGFEDLEENKKHAAEIATQIVNEILDNYKT